MTDQSPDDIDVLMPDRDVPVGGKTVTVHSFRMLEGMRAAAMAEPVLAAFSALFAEKKEPAWSSIEAILVSHPEITLELIAMATREPADWLAELSDGEGHLLMLTFWNVNRYFFLGRTIKSVALEKLAAERAERSAGEKSPSP